VEGEAGHFGEHLQRGGMCAIVKHLRWQSQIEFWESC